MNPGLSLIRIKGFSFYLPFLILLVAVTFTDSCSSGKSHSYGSPTGYNFSKPYMYKLPAILDEISGLYFYPKDSGIFAIQDEKGWLFKIHLKNPLQIERWKFSNGADYEDLSLVDSSFYVLRSKGVVEKFRFMVVPAHTGGVGLILFKVIVCPFTPAENPTSKTINIEERILRIESLLETGTL